MFHGPRLSKGPKVLMVFVGGPMAPAHKLDKGQSDS